MIDRQHHKIAFECDTCPEVLECRTEDFSEAWLEAKAEGWKSKKIGDEWVHGCSRCGV